MSTYAAFYNVSEGMKAQAALDARRASSNSSNSSSSVAEPTSSSKKNKNIFRSIVNGLKPAEKSQKPTPIYQRERPLFKSF